ncbi:MAG: DUF2892 domain-containing protein [Cyanobacteria bacterium P01_A01_bin.45]
MGTGLVFFSIIPVITALIGNCPLYTVLGISTIQANSNLRSK